MSMHREIVKQIWYTQLCYGQSVVIKKKKIYMCEHKEISEKHC